MFKSPLFWKIVTLGGAILLLLIPLTMVRQIIVERSDYRDEVEDAIRQSTSGPQKMVGPLIAIPVTELYTSLEDGKEIQRKRSYIHFWLPESLVVEGNQNVEARKIGIYEGQVWHNDVSVKAEFNAERLSDLNHPNISIGKPFIVVGVGDARGIGVVKAPQVNGTSLAVEPGTGLDGRAQGIHIPLPDASWAEQNLSMALSLNLSGTGDFSVVPVGRNSEMTLTSNWPHPNFLGDFLPAKREISESGFKAQWQSSWFAISLGERLKDEKIGWLGVTNLRLHPMQYLLVGLSLVMFYLLLLALSEHIGFTAAWITASLVGALMNGVYLQAILQGWRNSILFTVALLGLDGVMWVLLRSQDSSLLLGTGVLLFALCGVMFLTRHLDWHSLAQPKTKPKSTELPELQPAQCDEFRLWK